MRAPLTVLKGDIDVTLKRDRTVEEYRETLIRCREEVERLTRLAGDLLLLARADSSVPLEHVEDVDCRALLDRVRVRFESIAAARGIRFVVHADDGRISGMSGCSTGS
ncbi:MAG: hypothetical protein IPO52_15445 [Gemmatimonadetes bacterium]|nr:hypothetical protein [Gemmatimonadota bacterium]